MKIAVHTVCRLFFVICCWSSLVGCAEESTEVQAPLDASLETEDSELRRFVADTYEKAIRNPDSALHRGRLGMVYDANGFVEAAVVTYGQAHDLDADDMRWPYLQSLALSVQGRIDEALVAMDIAIQLAPTYLPAYLAKGYWMIDLGEFRRACDTFEQASTISDIENSDISLLLGLAQCQLELGETEKAIQTLDALPSSDLPAYAKMVRDRVNRADDSSIRIEAGAIDIGELGQISWSDPVSGAVVEYTHGLTNEALLAQKLIDGGRAEDGLRIIKNLRERHPEVTYLIELNSAALVALDRRDEAIALLQEGIQSHPDEYLLYFNLGLLLESVGQIDLALNHYDLAIKHQPEFVPAYDAKATLLLAKHKNSMAREVLEASLAHRTPDARTFYLIGVLWGGVGDWLKSTEYLTSANALEPDNVDVLSSLALSLSELDRKDEAIDAINRARELAPEDVKVTRAVATLMANGVIQ